MLKLKHLPPIAEWDDHQDDRIEEGKSYLAKIFGKWHAGKFSRQWYGWNFDNWGTSGIQLDNSIEELYEIVEKP